MTTVNGKLIGVANPQRVEMSATLVDVTGKTAVGYVASVPGELVKPQPIIPATDGTWSVELTANASITSDVGDTLWCITEGRALDGTPVRMYIAVPSTGGPYWVGSIRAALADTQTGTGAVTSLVQSVNGQQGVVVLDAADVGADTAGSATAAQATATAAAATDATSKVAAHTVASDPHGDRAWADDKFATSLDLTSLSGTVNTLSTSVTTLDGFVQDCLNRVSAIEQGTAFLAGVNSTGPVRVIGNNLTVERQDGTGAYRFRVTGSGKDLEVSGGDVIVSHWTNADFTGTQTALMRWEAAGPHLIGRTQFGTTPYDTVFDLDAAGGKLGLFGAAAVARQVVGGSRSDGTALANLLAALEAYGLIDDQTTA
jgi:hypothetical protein